MILGPLFQKHLVFVYIKSARSTQGSFKLNEPCAAIWDNDSGRQWCISMICERIGKDEYLIDYLERGPNNTTKKTWRCPSKVTEQNTQKIHEKIDELLN